MGIIFPGFSIVAVQRKNKSKVRDRVFMVNPLNAVRKAQLIRGKPQLRPSGGILRIANKRCTECEGVRKWRYIIVQ